MFGIIVSQNLILRKKYVRNIKEILVVKSRAAFLRLRPKSELSTKILVSRLRNV